MEAIQSNLDAIIHYPDPEASRLRSAVSKRIGLSPEMIVAGNGAIEIIYLLIKLLKAREVLIPAPTFNEYEIAVKINNGFVKDLLLDKNNGFVIDKESIFETWEHSDAIFICNPNNPTGVLTGRDDLLDIIDNAARKGKTVIVDEAFMDFIPDKERYSVIDLVPHYDNLFVLYSLTKFFAIPGLRLGIGIGNPSIIKRLNEIRDPWNVNCFAHIAGIYSLEDKDYIDSTIKYVFEAKDYLYQRINAIEGFKPLYPSANYVFTDVSGTGLSSTEICENLGKQGILVRDCSSFKNLGPEYIRTAVKNREDNEKLIAAFTNLGRN